MLYLIFVFLLRLLGCGAEAIGMTEKWEEPWVLNGSNEADSEAW